MVLTLIIGNLKDCLLRKINSIKTSDYGLTPYLDYYDRNKLRIKFNGGCLKQD